MHVHECCREFLLPLRSMLRDRLVMLLCVAVLLHYSGQGIENFPANVG